MINMKIFFGAAGIIIFLFGAFPAFAEEPSVFLTNQNGVKTTQFEITDEIYVEGLCLPANQDAAKIYVAYDKTWQEGDKLSDVSGGIETFSASADGTVPHTKIWANPIQGTYDVLIDSNNDFVLQAYEQKCVIGLTGAGFTVGNPMPPPTSPPPASPPPSSPPPASTPPSTKPSKSFSVDEYVETNSLSNVRKSAGGTALGTQAQGTLGIVIGGPTQASLGGKYFWFWKIDFEDGPDGWVSESNLESAAAPLKEIGITDNVATTSLTAATGTDIGGETLEKEERQTMVAQISAAFRGFGSNPLMSSIIVGAALFSGLVVSSIIISRAIRPPSGRRAKRQPRRQARRQPQPRRINIQTREIQPPDETPPPQP